MVLSAAALHGQLVHAAQTGRGLARVEDDGARAGDGVHELTGQRGDAGHAPQEVERRPLGGEQARAGPVTTARS